MNLLASSATLEGIQKLIAKYYGGSTITLHPQEDNFWTVHIEKRKNRYRFYRTS